MARSLEMARLPRRPGKLAPSLAVELDLPRGGVLTAVGKPPAGAEPDAPAHSISKVYPSEPDFGSSMRMTAMPLLFRGSWTSLTWLRPSMPLRRKSVMLDGSGSVHSIRVH